MSDYEEVKRLLENDYNQKKQALENDYTNRVNKINTVLNEVNSAKTQANQSAAAAFEAAANANKKATSAVAADESARAAAKLANDAAANANKAAASAGSAAANAEKQLEDAQKKIEEVVGVAESAAKNANDSSANAEKVLSEQKKEFRDQIMSNAGAFEDQLNEQSSVFANQMGDQRRLFSEQIGDQSRSFSEQLEQQSQAFEQTANSKASAFNAQMQEQKSVFDSKIQSQEQQFSDQISSQQSIFQEKEAERDAAVAEATKVAENVTALALKVDEKSKALEASANKAIEDANKAIVDVEQIDAEIVEHFLVVTDRNGDKHKIDLYDALQKITYEIVNTDVEGYMRVAGISDPSLSYRQFPRSEFGKSVFSIFYPCLVGNNFTGRVGEILHILDKLNYERDIEGNARMIDGSEGEVLITNIKSYWAIHGRYKIDGVEYDVFLESLNPFTFHGIEAIEVKPFGWSPDYCVSHNDADNVTRMHSVYNPAWAGSYSAPIGIVGRYNYSTDEDGNIVEQYDAAGLINGDANGNHTTDIALYTGEQYAMNINADKTKTYPYMNHTARGAELLWANMVAETGTFDAHKESLMGSGYCCDYSASAASYWDAAYTGARNGIRYVAADGTTKYTTFGYFTALQKQVFGLNINSMAQMINQYRSPWKCLERHRVIAYAIENKIAELTWFTFEGNKYKWRSVPGIAGPDGGEMTCVLWKIMSANLASGTIDPTDGVTSVAGNRIEYLVSTALYHGMVTDVSPSWWTSGLIFAQYGDGTYRAYMQRDQKKLIISENATKNEDESFNFEARYKQVGDVYDKAEGYRKNYCNDAFILPDTNANLKGAALHTYVGAYNWFTGAAPAVGKKASRGFRRGYLANAPSLSPLTMVGVFAPSTSSSSCAFGICCEIEISGS